MPPLLAIEGVSSGYGRVQVLHELSLGVPEGQVVAVLGPNGVGKTTLLRTISGTLPVRQGTIRLDGERLDGRSPHEIARRGVTHVPEGRGVFPGLSVRDNLDVAAHAARDRDPATRGERIDRVLEMFPRLGERLSQLAGTLSGGERQMLALGRAFLAEPRVLLLDEISMGLGPMIVDELFERVAQLKEEGRTVVLVEQYLTFALGLADLCYVMGKGRVTFAGEPAELVESGAIESAYLGSDRASRSGHPGRSGS